MSDDPEPTCLDTLNDPSDSVWQRPTSLELRTREPCSFCFPNADSVADIDPARAELLISPDGDVVHHDADYGEATTDCYHSRGATDLNRTLSDPDFGPEDLGLSGGDA